MNYLGKFAEQDIFKSNEYQKLYDYTLPQAREVILYYTLEEQCCVLRQIAVCSEITEYYSMYWVFAYEYVAHILNLDDFKKSCLQIVEKEILPYIQKEIMNQK